MKKGLIIIFTCMGLSAQLYCADGQVETLTVLKNVNWDNAQIQASTFGGVFSMWFRSGGTQTVVFKGYGSTDTWTGSPTVVSSVTFSSDTHSIGGVLYKFPPDDGTSGQVMETNGSGVLTWGTDDTGAGGGDNLGSHIATQTLDVGGFNLIGVASSTHSGDITSTNTIRTGLLAAGTIQFTQNGTSMTATSGTGWLASTVPLTAVSTMSVTFSSRTNLYVTFFASGTGIAVDLVLVFNDDLSNVYSGRGERNSVSASALNVSSGIIFNIATAHSRQGEFRITNNVIGAYKNMNGSGSINYWSATVPDNMVYSVTYKGTTAQITKISIAARSVAGSGVDVGGTAISAGSYIKVYEQKP